MKKVLFTLAALMMAGSAMADDYMYIPDFEVSQAQLGTTIEVYVAAHYDAAVSAWDLKFQMPEGMTISYAEQGADMTISYIKANGRTGSLVAPLYFQEAGHYITAVADPGYYQVDGAWVSYGAVKWLAGDYEEMIYMEVDVAADFKGGEITVITTPSCGQDARPDVTPCVSTTYTKVCNVTVEQGEDPTTPFVGTADVTFNGNIATISYSSNDPNATVEVTLNGDPLNVEFVNGVATYEAPTTADAEGTYTYTVAIKVTPTDAFPGEPVSDSDTYSFTMEKTAAPVINVVDENAHHSYFTVTGEGDVHVYVDGVEVFPNANGQYAVYAVEGQPVTYVVTATAQGAGKLISDEASKTITFAAWDGVDELVNGKTVAGVRYYNMAGQEMQEANGMTIVVTTYTDGTTSAVKVMK